MTDKLDELMKKYWDAVDARRHDEAERLMKEIGERTRARPAKQRYLGGKNARW